MSWAVTLSRGFLKDSMEYLKSCSPVSKVQDVFYGIAKRIYQEVIELSPHNFRWAECLLVMCINNRDLTVAWQVLHTMYEGKKIIHQMKGVGVMETALKIAVFTYGVRQVSAALLEVHGDTRPCVGGVKEAIRPPLDCLIAGKKVAECAALADESYNSSIFVLTQQNGKVLLISTNPGSTSACFFHFINTPVQEVVRVCFDDVKSQEASVMLMDPIVLGNIYNQLGDGRSMVHIKMKPIWPCDVPCEVVHVRPADLDLGNEITCIRFFNFPKDQSFCFNPANPSAASFQNILGDPLQQGPKTDQPSLYIFQGKVIKSPLNDAATE
jgi:hypothetical protein